MNAAAHQLRCIIPDTNVWPHWLITSCLRSRMPTATTDPLPDQLWTGLESKMMSRCAWTWPQNWLFRMAL
jgi:hypothetical protein